jgi:hypothetical protein
MCGKLTIVVVSLLGAPWASATMEERAIALIAAEDNAVAQAQAAVDRAEAIHGRVREAVAASIARANNLHSLWRKSSEELKKAEQAVSKAKSERDVNLASNLRDSRRRLETEARATWQQAVEEAHNRKEDIAEPLSALDRAQEELAEAIAHRLGVRRQIEMEFRDHLPPWVTDVKVFGQDGTVYHGYWIPQNEQLRRRMAALDASINHAPERLNEIKDDLNTAITMANKAALATTLAMDEYRAYVVGDAATQIAIDLADVAQTLARDARAGGVPGLAISTLVELGRAVRNIDQKRQYWDLQRLPGLNQDYRETLGISDALTDLGFEREAILRLEKAMQAAESTHTPPGDLRRQAHEIMRSSQTEATADYIEVIAADTVKEILNTLSDPALEAAARSPNRRVREFVKTLSGGELKQREVDFVKQGALYGLNLGADLGIAKVKSKLQNASTSVRLSAFQSYLERWLRQVWLENEVVQTSRDYWALRRAVANAEIELDRLMGMHGSHRDRNRVPVSPVNFELENDSDFQVDIAFSSDVVVSSVVIDGREVVGKGSGQSWSGAFNSKELSGHLQLVITARAPLSGYELDSPYKAPLWSSETNAFNGYAPGPDKYHFLDVQASKGSGIKVGVADMFGHEGLRVKPANGITAFVFDEDGEEVALSAIESGFLTDFIPLKPGSYTLRLNIGNYVPALPPHCNDGYVRQFSLAKNEQLQFTASVYTARVANNGQSAGVVQGECINLKTP